MDLNLAVIAGRLAGQPEIKQMETGGNLVRLLITTRTDEPRRRIDVVPVTWWHVSDDELLALHLERGDRVWVAGSIQRRFWSDDHSRRSRIEVVAHHVQKNIDVPELEESEA